MILLIISRNVWDILKDVLGQDAYKAIKDPDGNYYFTYSSDGYWFYTAVREGAEKYYRIAFYCFGDVRTQYAEQFEQWAKTIEVA